MKIKKLIKRLSEDGHMIKIRKGDVKITVYPIFQNDEGGAGSGEGRSCRTGGKRDAAGGEKGRSAEGGSGRTEREEAGEDC